MEENKELRLAYGFAEHTNRNIFLTGKAGTGKTTFLRNLRSRTHKRLIVTAPTGVAAINAGGVTLHSFFQLSFGPQVPEAIREDDYTHRFGTQKKNIIRSMDLLIIDEISMVRADLLDAVDKVLRRFRHPHQPFGGVQLLMIGDLQQLAPVVKDEEKELLQKHYRTPYFFSSKALQQTTYVSIELTKVYRQEDDVFIDILNKVRSNQTDRESMQLLNSRYDPSFSPREEEEYVTLCTHNVQADRINSDRIGRLKGQSETYRAVVEGKFPELSYPTESELKLKVGAQVMFCKNDTGRGTRRYYNGKIGRVKRLGKIGVEVECQGESELISVEPVKWENTRYIIEGTNKEIREVVEGTFLQLPLKLAWAITIHKSQGLTFQHAIINAGHSFAHGQVYVALSRCKSLEGMVLQTPLTSTNIITDSTIHQFIQQVETHVPTEGDLRESRMRYQQQILSEILDFRDIERPMNSLSDLAVKHPSAFPDAIASKVQEYYQAVRTEVTEVSSRFTRQCQRILKDNPEVENNEELEERLRKAAAYFSEKTDLLVGEGLLKTIIEIDHKEIQKQVEIQMRRLEEAYAVRKAVLGVLKERFRVTEILNARAAALMNAEEHLEKEKKRKVSKVEAKNLSTEHPILFNRLRTYRMAMADERNVAAYDIYSKKVLYALCELLPTNEKDLRKIKGIGSERVRAFGSDILEIIREYCDEKGISYPGQMSKMDFMAERNQEKV